MAKQDDWERITLRLPKTLHKWLTGTSSAKSLNAEIVERLEYLMPGGGLEHSLDRLVAVGEERQSRLSELTEQLKEERVERLKAENDAETFHSSVIQIHGDRERLNGEVEGLQNELAQVKRERDQALQRGAVLDVTHDLLEKFVAVYDRDKEVFDEIEKVTRYLEGDAVALEAELYEDGPGFRPDGPGEVKAYLATRIVEIVDRRIKLVLEMLVEKISAPGQRHKNILTARSLALAHQVGLSEEDRDIANTYFQEGPSDNPSEFYEYVMSQIDAAPEETRQTNRAALDRVMPKLFLGWGRKRKTGGVLS